jgi:hypothetical protein
MTKEEIMEKLDEVRIAIKVLCFLYPRAGGYDEPHCAGVVLRRFHRREEDMVAFLTTIKRKTQLEPSEERK